jgi:hypothetical protein
MRAFALAEIGRSEAIDVYLRREDAWAALEEILNDEPDWAGSALRRSHRARRTEGVRQLVSECGLRPCPDGSRWER